MLGTLFFITWIFYHIFFCFSNFYASFLSVKQYVYRRQNFSSGYFLQIYIFFLGFCKSTLNTKKRFFIFIFYFVFLFPKLVSTYFSFFSTSSTLFTSFPIKFHKKQSAFPSGLFFYYNFLYFLAVFYSASASCSCPLIASQMAYSKRHFSKAQPIS